MVIVLPYSIINALISHQTLKRFVKSLLNHAKMYPAVIKPVKSKIMRCILKDLSEIPLVKQKQRSRDKEQILTAILLGELKHFTLPAACRMLVEFGHGLSTMKTTGLIGVDESIIDTCSVS